jgi:hypothetical protein
MDEIAKEIITADELKKYLAKQWTQRPCEYFNKVVKEFTEMKDNEKVIWGFYLKFDNPTCNILLTNNGKILYIMPDLNMNMNCSGYYVGCGRSNIVNHDFQIPLECIYTIKTLIKNISGRHQISTTIMGHHCPTPPKFHHTDFDAIYDNLNEYLKHLKTMMIAKNEQMAEMESMRLQKEEDALLINEQMAEMERMRLLINELVNEQVLEHERIKENERIRLQKEKDTLLINLLDMPLENGPQHPILSGLM